MIDLDAVRKPITLHTDTVDEKWVDEYDHMNVAYYVLVCDQATYGFWQMVNEGRELSDRNGFEYAVVETHVNYISELRLNDRVTVTTQLLDYDAKRFHLYHELHHESEQYLAATNEVMALGFNLTSRAIQPFDCRVTECLEKIFSAHKLLDKPANAGRTIQIRKSASESHRVPS